MKTVDHKCPSCNASINYNPKSKNWVCEYCGSKFTLEQLEANEKNFESTSVKDSKELKKEPEERRHRSLGFFRNKKGRAADLRYGGRYSVQKDPG